MKAKNVVLSGLFVAFGIVLPMIFHMFSMGGPAFLPMHIPVLICGLFLGPFEGLIVGMVTPIISSLLTGMPVAFPMLPIMIFELGIYGLMAGYFYKKMNFNLYLSMIMSMVGGRIVAGIIVLVLSTFFGFKGVPPVAFVKGAIVTGMPGIIIQLIFIPLIVKLLKRSSNTSIAYNK